MTVLLVVAKAPVAGLAKTRLCPPATPLQAAEIAAAALLDTLDTVFATPGVRPVVALTGDLGRAVRRLELSAALRRCHVVIQRGDDFAGRLVNAHLEVAARYPGEPVLQIGMDTPQVEPGVLASAVGRLRDGCEAVLGPALDGGWWALGLRAGRHAVALRDVEMSTPRTGVLTRAALVARGLGVEPLPPLSDVDTMADAFAVADMVPGTRFAAAVWRVAPADYAPVAGR